MNKIIIRRKSKYKSNISIYNTIYYDTYSILIVWIGTSSNSALTGVSELKLLPQIIQREAGRIIVENRLSKDLLFLKDYKSIPQYETHAWIFQERKLSRRSPSH